MSLLSSYASPWKTESEQPRKRTPQIKNMVASSNEETFAEKNVEKMPGSNSNTNPIIIQKTNKNAEESFNSNDGSLTSSKMNNLLNKMTDNETTDGKMAIFNPPPNPILQKKEQFNPIDLLPAGTPPPLSSIHKNANSSSSYAANENNLGIYNNYKKSYEPPKNLQKPYYSKMSGGDDSYGNDKLLEKINYMIHLLEEQQNEKTNNETEEFILYSFLGIFMIFIVDSFTKVGKYTR